MTELNEIWVAVPAPEFATAYQVSNYGRVRSVPRVANSEMFIFHTRTGILKGRIERDGNRTVRLSLNRNRRKFYVRDLVAMAFIPNPCNFSVVTRRNGELLDDRALNLYWSAGEVSPC